MTKNSPTKNTTTSSNTNSNTNNTNTNTTYIKLKTRLEKLGYTQPFDPNSMNLIICLLNDLCQTTETCRSLKYTHTHTNSNTKHLNSANEVELLNQELKNLIIENTQLHKDLIQHSELRDQREKEIMKMVRGYESEIGELKFMNQMYLKKVEELRLGSERERVEMGRVLANITANTNTNATVINNHTASNIEISKGLEPITTPYTPYTTHTQNTEKEMYIGDLLKIQQNQLDTLRNENLDLQKRNTDLNEQLEQLFNQVEMRNEEITRLGSLLHGTATYTNYTTGGGGTGNEGVEDGQEGMNIKLLVTRNEELSNQLTYLYESIADLELHLSSLQTEKSQLERKSEREVEGLKEEIEGYKRREVELKRDLVRMEKIVKELEGRKGYSIGARGATGIRKSSSSGGDKKVGGSAIPVKKQVLRETTTKSNTKTTTKTTKKEESVKEWKDKYHTLEKELQIAIQRVSYLEKQIALGGTSTGNTTADTAGNTVNTSSNSSNGNSFKETYNGDVQLYKHISTQTSNTPTSGDATREVKGETGSGNSSSTEDVGIQTVLEMGDLKDLENVRELLRNEEMRVRELEGENERMKDKYGQLVQQYEQLKEQQKENMEKEKESRETTEKEKVEERIMQLEGTISDLRKQLEHAQQQQLQSLEQSPEKTPPEQLQSQSLEQSQEIHESESMYTFSEQLSFKQLNTDHSPTVSSTDNTTPTTTDNDNEGEVVQGQVEVGQVEQVGNTKETLYTQNTEHTQHTTSEKEHPLIENPDHEQKEYIHKLESEVETLNNTIKHLEHESEQWKQRVLRMDEERDGYIHELDQSAEEIQRLRGEVLMLRGHTTSSTTGAGIDAGVGQKWEEIRRLQVEVEEEKRKCKEIRMMYDSLSVQMRMIEHRNSEMEREYQTLLNQVDGLTEENTNKESILKERDAELKRMNQEVVELGGEVERVKREYIEKEREFGECYGRLMECIHERQILEQQLHQVQIQLERSEQEKLVREGEYEILMSRLEGSEGRVKELEINVEEKQGEIVEQSQQISLLKQTIEEYHNQLKHCQDSEIHTQYILNQISQKNNELEKQIKYYQLENERIKEEICSVKRERDILRSEVEELRREYLSLEAVLEGERRRYALTAGATSTGGLGAGGGPEPSAPVLPPSHTEHGATTDDQRVYLKEEWKVVNPSAPPLVPFIPHSQHQNHPVFEEAVKETGKETKEEKKEVGNGEMKKLPIAKSLGQILPTSNTATTTTGTTPNTTTAPIIATGTPATTTTTGKTETKSTTAQVQTEMIKSLAEYSQTEHHTIAKYVQTDDRDSHTRGNNNMETAAVMEIVGTKKRERVVEKVEKQTGMTPSSTSSSQTTSTKSSNNNTNNKNTNTNTNNNRSPPLNIPKPPSDAGIQEWTPERNRSKVEERIMSELRHTKQQLKRFENMIEQRFIVSAAVGGTTTLLPTATTQTTTTNNTTPITKPNTTSNNEEDSTTIIENEESSSDLALELLKTWKAQNEAMRRELLSIPTAFPELLQHLRSTTDTTAQNSTARVSEVGRRAEEENELMMRVIQEVARDLKQVTP